MTGTRKGAEASTPGIGALAGLGVQFVVAILLFLFAGRWLDARLGTAPWLMILGVFVGAGGATVAMYRRVFPPDQAGPPAPRPPGR